MTIRELKEILKHYESEDYDDWQVILWDYNQQQTIDWGITYSSNKTTKELCFPIAVPIVDDSTIFEKLENIIKENGYEKKKD